jgi:hypothetical protein
VAADIVDPLEAIQVEEAKSMFPPLLCRAFERLGKAALELGAVHQVGQGVVRRLVRQLLRHLAGTGDIPNDENYSRDGTVRFPDRRCRYLNYATGGFKAMPQPGLERGERRSGAEACNGRTLEGGPLNLAHQRQDLDQRPAKSKLAGVAREPFGSLIEELNLAGTVAGHHRLGQFAEQGVEFSRGG